MLVDACDENFHISLKKEKITRLFLDFMILIYVSSDSGGCEAFLEQASMSKSDRMSHLFVAKIYVTHRSIAKDWKSTKALFPSILYFISIAARHDKQDDAEIE